MFPTLILKTFAVLAGSLVISYIGSIISGNIFRRSIQTGNIQNISKIMWGTIIVNIIAILLLVLVKVNLLLSAIFMFLFTFSSGFSLGFIFATTKQDIVQKALLITALTTVVTGLVASYSGIDFTWMGKFLFWALSAFIIVSIIGLFVKIKGAAARIKAGIGVLIFTAYLLFDFSHLAKFKNVAEANNWNTALDFAVSIYLDIFNLLLQLLDLFGGR